MENQTFKAVAAKIDIGIGISVDAYMLSNATIRYGQDYISLLLGYSEGYVSQLGKKSVNKLKALKARGFTADVIAVSVSRMKGGATRPKTLSFNDFCIFVEYEAGAEVRNPKAIALLTSSFRELVIERTRLAFGLPGLSLEEKQAVFKETYDTYLDRVQDEEDLFLPGDTLERPDLCQWEDYLELANKDELVEFYANYDFAPYS